jgi:anti-sigma-K factor RskA
MTDGRHISAEDMALLALQALSIEESDAAQAHVEQCAECRADLAALQGDLALVALTAEPHALPAGARDRFLARIAADAGAAAPSAKVVSIEQRRAPRAALWVSYAAVAALLIVCAWLGWRVNRLDAQLREESARAAKLAETTAHAQEIEEVLTAPAAQRVLLTAVKTPPSPTGRAVYLASRGGLIFQANNLAALQDAKTYELWVIPANGQAAIPAGLFRPDALGNASVVLPPLPAGVPAKAFGVTVEKASGSETPTAPILLLGAVASGE